MFLILENVIVFLSLKVLSVFAPLSSFFTAHTTAPKLLYWAGLDVLDINLILLEICVWHLFISLCQKPSRSAWMHLAVQIWTRDHLLVTPALNDDSSCIFLVDHSDIIPVSIVIKALVSIPIVQELCFAHPSLCVSVRSSAGLLFNWWFL